MASHFPFLRIGSRRLILMKIKLLEKNGKCQRRQTKPTRHCYKSCLSESAVFWSKTYMFAHIYNLQATDLETLFRFKNTKNFSQNGILLHRIERY